MSQLRTSNFAIDVGGKLAYIDVLNDHLKFAIDCKVAFEHVPATLHEAQHILQNFGVIDEQQEFLESLCHPRTIGKHALIIDDALGSCVKARIERERGVSYFGFGFSSDESPAAAAMLRGFRIQITICQVLFFVPVERWSDREYDNKRPFTREALLCDMMHAAAGPKTALHD